MIDLATALGLLFGLAITLFVMLTGADLSLFFNTHAFIIVFGGVLTATLVRFSFKSFLQSLYLGLTQAFIMRPQQDEQLLSLLSEMAAAKRKNTPLPRASHPFLARGLKLVQDGFEADFIRLALERARETRLTQLEEAAHLFRTIGEAAPAFGMIGTLIGMVQMFANMQDPTTLGPFMATALLATLYSALLANSLALPLADKLEQRLEAEDRHLTLITEGILALKAARSPLFIRETLTAFLPIDEKEAL